MSDDIDEIEETPELDAAAVQRLLKNYRAAEIGEAREARWRAFSEKEREALEAIGVSGPMIAIQGDDEPLQLDTDELRKMDPAARREAKEEFERATSTAEVRFKGGLSRLMRGEVDAAQTSLDRLAEIRDEAENAADPNVRSALLQEGARMIASLEAVDRAESMNPTNRTYKRYYRDPLTRRPMVEAVDTQGKRTYELDQEVSPEQFKAPAPEPLPDTVTPEEYLKWPADKRHRFVREQPDAYRALLATTDR